MLHTITRTLPRVASAQLALRPVSRAVHTSPVALKDAFKSPKPLSEGHATFEKSDSKLQHDPQSSSAAEGMEAKETGTDSEGPFDAAVQGHGKKGGKKTDKMKEESAKNTGQSGAFADQIGGQPGGSQDATQKKGEESAAGQSSGAVGVGKNVANSGFDGLKQMRKDGRNFSTSARAYQDKKPAETGKEEKGLKGDQNEHLKHKSASEKDQGKGNAASTPHLPSKSGKSGDKRSLHTSAISRSKDSKDSKDSKSYVEGIKTEPVKAGYSAPQGGHQPQSGYLTPPSPPKDLKASSEIPHSSSAVDPPNATLQEQAKAGTLADRNPQPNAKVGEMGLDEAWKHRK